MNNCKEKRDLVELILRHVEGRSNTAHPSTAHPQQAGQPSQTNPSRPHPQHGYFIWPSQPRSSPFQPTSSTQPVQVCIIIQWYIYW